MKTYYWVRTTTTFFGPFPSRRKAGRSLYVAKSVRERNRRHCSEMEAHMSTCLTESSDVVSLTIPQMLLIDELMSIDEAMLQNAY